MLVLYEYCLSPLSPLHLRNRLFGLIATPNGALRVPPAHLSFAASPKSKKNIPETKCFLLARTRAARGVYLSTGLSCNLLSYIAPS
jgi:hypothetical protein